MKMSCLNAPVFNKTEAASVHRSSGAVEPQESCGTRPMTGAFPSRLEIDQGAGRDIAEVVDAGGGEAGHVGRMLPILQPDRHRSGVDLLHCTQAPAGELRG